MDAFETFLVLGTVIFGIVSFVAFLRQLLGPKTTAHDEGKQTQEANTHGPAPSHIEQPPTGEAGGALKYLLPIGAAIAFLVAFPACLCGAFFSAGLLEGPEFLDHWQNREAISLYAIPALVVALVAFAISLLLLIPLRRQSRFVSLYLRVIGVVALGLFGILILVEVSVRSFQTPVVPPVAELIGHDGAVTSVAFSPDGTMLASGGIDHTVRLWDWTVPGSIPTILTGHMDVVRDVAFGPGGDLLASGGNDRTIFLWNLLNPDQSPTSLAGHEHYVTALAFTPDGASLASCSGDDTIRLWDLSDPGNDSVVVSNDYVHDIAVGSDGEILAFSGNEVYVRRLDESFNPVAEFPSGGRQVLSIDISSDGRHLAASAGPSEGVGGVIHLWDLTDPHAPPIILEGHTNTVATVSLSPDGRILASEGTSSDPTVHVWNVADPAPELIILRGAYPTDLDFSPSGKYLAVAGGDGRIRIWDVDDLLGVKSGSILE